MLSNSSAFEPKIILKLFLNIEGVATFENGRVIFKFLLMSYLIIKQNKSSAKELIVYL